MTTMARNHLRKVYGPELSDADLERETRRLMDSYARYYMELFLLPSMAPARIEASTRFEGLEHVRAAREEGNGVVIAMPHTGNWDLAGTLGQRGREALAAPERQPGDGPQRLRGLRADPVRGGRRRGALSLRCPGLAGRGVARGGGHARPRPAVQHVIERRRDEPVLVRTGRIAVFQLE